MGAKLVEGLACRKPKPRGISYRADDAQAPVVDLHDQPDAVDAPGGRCRHRDLVDYDAEFALEIDAVRLG